MEKRIVEEIYTQHIKPLPVEERLRLIEMTVRDLRTQPAKEEQPERYD
jgi:hypothetical protein